MSFNYTWKQKEANFGEPVEMEVAGGTHFSCELILKFNGEYLALRRPEAIPGHEIPEKAQNFSNGALYFVHRLPRWGESLEDYVSRGVREQAGVEVKGFKVVDLEMEVYKDSQQWAITPYLIVEIDSLPVAGEYGNQVTEVVTFGKDNIPDEFGWWSKEELQKFLEKYD